MAKILSSLFVTTPRFHKVLRGDLRLLLGNSATAFKIKALINVVIEYDRSVQMYNTFRKDNKLGLNCAKLRRA